MASENDISFIKAIGDFSVIVDDCVNDGTEPKPEIATVGEGINVIDSIRLFLLKNHIPVVCYRTVPSDPSVFSGASLSIIDWDMTSITAARAVVEESVKDMIEEHVKRFFSPVLIVTSESLDVIKSALEEEDWYPKNTKRIILKKKDDFKIDGFFSDKRFVAFLQDTFSRFPSLKVLSEWHQAMLDGGNELFTEMSELSPSWAKTLFDNFADGENDVGLALESKRRHFGSFLCTNLLGRVDFTFKSLESEEELPVDTTLGKVGETPNYLLERIVEHSRLVLLGDENNGVSAKPHAGDLFVFNKNESLLKDYVDLDQLLENEDYCLLNIRAQCDFARKKKDVYPKLYCLLGTFSNTLKKSGGAKYPIIVKNDRIIDSDNKSHLFSEITGYQESELKQLERVLNEEDPTRCGGDYSEKPSEAIVSCVLGHNSVSFQFHSLFVIPFEAIKSLRKATLLDPYLSRVQQKFSLYMVRVGVPNTPLNDLYK
ncbi:MAG: hypothetical protein LKJ88_03295 [Bacilli bacterium]|jgi:hypothetical protein|nr:hypothetical protein [Bacilli bacterium]